MALVGAGSGLGLSESQIAAILADTVVIGAAGAGLTALATAAELAKVPKSDSTVTWNATALASINEMVDQAFNTLIPETNTPGSANDILRDVLTTSPSASVIADAVRTELTTELGRIDAAITTRAASATALSNATWTDARAGYLDELAAANLPTDVAGLATAIADVPTAAEILTAFGTGATLTACATATGFATAANLATLDTLVDRMAPLLVGTVTGAGTGTEVYVYGGVTATVTVDEDGNVSDVTFT
jgi:hypothetical protein